jgi:preprotein translocase subunit SecY
MADMKFGFGQIGEETPKIISRIKRALNFLSGAIVTVLPQVADLFHTTTAKVSLIIGLAIVAVNFVGIMFGVEPDQSK